MQKLINCIICVKSSTLSSFEFFLKSLDKFQNISVNFKRYLYSIIRPMSMQVCVRYDYECLYLCMCLCAVDPINSGIVLNCYLQFTECSQNRQYPIFSDKSVCFSMLVLLYFVSEKWCCIKWIKNRP